MKIPNRTLGIKTKLVLPVQMEVQEQFYEAEVWEKVPITYADIIG